MLSSKDKDFLIERRFHKLDPQLHKRFNDTVVVLLRQLQNYQHYFPEYTDHTELHAMTIIDYCNRLIGEENIEFLNADELYVLLMGCYLHDIGMGVRKVDYEEFCEELGLTNVYNIYDVDKAPQFIRLYHHEFSGCYVRKYADLLDLPSKEHTFAVAQLCRGHRKTDLFDPDEFPQALAVPGGNTICMPYLAAILRMGDELDVSDRRNLAMLYDVSKIKDEHQILEFKKHLAIKELDITQDGFTLHVDAQEKEVYDGIVEIAEKMQRELDYCVSVVSSRTPFEITQRQVIMKNYEG